MNTKLQKDNHKTLYHFSVKITTFTNLFCRGIQFSNDFFTKTPKNRVNHHAVNKMHAHPRCKKRINPTFPANLLSIYWISIVPNTTKTSDHYTNTFAKNN